MLQNSKITKRRMLQNDKITKQQMFQKGEITQRQMLQNGEKAAKNNILYIGPIKKIYNKKLNIFVPNFKRKSIYLVIRGLMNKEDALARFKFPEL